jgi:phospholipid transport system substrate-binding protein
MSRVFAAVVALVVVLACQPQARAASPTERLRGFFASAARALDDPRPEIRPEERMGAIRALVHDIFDFREAARLSLGPEWSARTPAERAEFVRLFADLLERSFISGIAARIRLSDGVHVSFIDESVDGTVATVRTAIDSKSGLELPFHYRMIERGQRWAVRDVVVDGVSLAANYRAQFGRILQTASYADLIRQLRARVAGSGLMAMAAFTEDSAPAALPPPPAPPVIDVPRPAAPEPAAPAAPAPPAATDTQTRDAGVTQPVPAPLPKVTIALAEPEPLPTRSSGVVTKNDVITKTAVEETTASAPPVREARVVPDVAMAPIQPSEPRLAPDVSAPPVRSASRTSHSRSYWVQAGAFANVDAARRLASALEEQEPASSRGRWVVVVEMVESGAPLARVRVGPFTGWAEAASKLRDVQSWGYKPFIAESRD